MARPKTSKTAAPKHIADLTHAEATRKNIPTVEHQSVMAPADQAPKPVRYPRGRPDGQEQQEPREGDLAAEKAQRNRDLDPQLVWRGKDEPVPTDLVVSAPPLYIQEKVKPKALVDALRRQAAQAEPVQLDFFGDFNGLPEGAERTEFYQHDGHWQNRMILGDSLQVMASLAEREGLRGKVQCIYFDPPYGIKFNSNFQWSTTSRDVKDGNAAHITREPEQVKAFRDTWRDGIHSYLSYLRDRLIVARDLLTESGSIFVQIGDENVHRVRCLMDEVFGEVNFVTLIPFKKTSSVGSKYIDSVNDYIIWHAKSKDDLKYRKLYNSTGRDPYAFPMIEFENGDARRLTSQEKSPQTAPDGRLYRTSNITSQSGGESTHFPVEVAGKIAVPSKNTFWKTNSKGMLTLNRAGRLDIIGRTLAFRRYQDDFPVRSVTNWWEDTVQSTFSTENIYVVQTYTKVIQRCILMSTDPGDLVLDPTCGSGTTAYVAEQWGRRWITIDTSRVALALARARIMGARYPYYLLADSPEGQRKEAELTRSAPSQQPTYGNIAHGFVCERVPHITLKAIANNAQIDTIWEAAQQHLEPLREQLNAALKTAWQEWEIPREADAKWPAEARQAHAAWWQARIARQREIDASIAARADYETLYDKPYEDRAKVRVAGPFTVESLSPHRVLGVDEEGEALDPAAKAQAENAQGFADLILDNLRSAGVQQAHKDDKIDFTALSPWPGDLVCAEAQFLENGEPRRAGIFIGPEFGTVTRAHLVEAARETADAHFDVLIACAFNYDAQASALSHIGCIRILKARMNADLHMAEDLKKTDKANLFVIFGEADVDVLDTTGRSLKRSTQGGREVIDPPAPPASPDAQLVVKINGVDVFHPSTGEIRSDGAEGIACWFLDSDYDGESFFVRHAYFLGANDPYTALKKTLKAEIDADAWETLHSATSRPFPVPSTGRFAIKIINHLGDEVMRVFRVG